MRASLFLLGLCCACQQPSPAVRTTAAQQVTAPRTAPNPTTAPPSDAPDPLVLQGVERLTASAVPSERLPLVVVLHGLGDTPEAFVSLYASLSVRARVVALRAPNAWSEGFSWFPLRTQAGWEDGFRAAEERVAHTIRALKRRHRSCPDVIVSGFSQGGMLSYGLLSQPSVVRGVLPIGGFLAQPLRPAMLEFNGPTSVLIGFHGEADERVSFNDARDTVQFFTRLGVTATLRSWPGVGHEITPVMRAELLRELAQMIRRFQC